MREIKFVLGFIIISSVLIAGFYFFVVRERLVVYETAIQNSNLRTTEIYSKLRVFLNPRVEENLKERDLYTLLFVGDIMLGRGVDYEIRKNGLNYKFPFLRAVQTLQDADLVFGNLEGPISDQGENQGSAYSFRFNPLVAEGLKFAGFDVMSLANNHIMDWGLIALQDTLDILFKSGIHAVGAGRNYREANNPLFVKLGDLNLAFLAYTDLYPKSFEATNNNPGISSFDLGKIKKSIAGIRAGTDIIVVSFHWGKEYEQKTGGEQKKMAQELIDAGADLIIGHHPHVVQEAERYKNGWIFYSLGNFVFDQNFSASTMQGLAVKVKIKNKEIKEVKELEVKINNKFQPEIISN